MGKSVTEDIAIYLASRGLGVRGSTIFRGYLPPQPAECLGIFAIGGAAADLTGNIDNPSIQVLVRAATYDAAESKAYDVFNTLHALTETVINGTRYLLIEALQDPISLGQDEGGNYLFSLNFRIMRENSLHTN